MNLTGGLVNFSSLNRGNGSGAIDKDAIESVRNFNGRYIPISGSSIKIHEITLLMQIHQMQKNR